MKIERIMTRPVKTCRRNDSMRVASQLMWEGDVGCIPVVDEDNRPVGMITDRDIAMAAYTQGKKLEDMPVESAMAREVFTCAPGDPVSAAEQLMQQAQVRRLPVVDADGVLLGIVSMNDLALEAAREKGRGKAELRLEDVSLTLARIGEHRHQALAAAQ